jgi:hypothetical protein
VAAFQAFLPGRVWTFGDRNGKSTTRFVRRPELRAVRGQIKAYQRLQKLVEEWVAASVEICEIKRRKAREE